ncbi:MAG: AIR synthase-related protein [Bacteroidales bacterium]|nr:AIR synthase-related protein [Bacteroidales bacterium]
MGAQAYMQLGVSADKKDVRSAVKGRDGGLYPGAFCKIVADMAGRDQWCTVMHSDGTGTKASLAYVYWRMTGDLSVWHNLAFDALAMNVDDMACVGVTDDILISALLNRNMRHIPADVVKAVIDGVYDGAATLTQLGIRTICCGGETADVGDLVRTLTFDVSAVANIQKKNVIDNSRIRPGDIIVGLASAGRCVYENRYNSGIGSNGLTLARHTLLPERVGVMFPESFDAAVTTYAYQGNEMDDDELLATMRDLLSPTRIYAPVTKAIASAGVDVHGMVHCTGGGMTKSRYSTGAWHVVKDNLFPVPDIFRRIRAGMPYGDAREMYEVFNMGHLMEIYVAQDDVDTVMDIAGRFGIDARPIGHVEESREPGCTTLVTPQGTFRYEN